MCFTFCSSSSENHEDKYSTLVATTTNSVGVSLKQVPNGPITFKVDALTLNAPIAIKLVCFSRLLKCLRSLYDKRCGPRSEGVVCSGSTLFASILNASVMLGSYLQQTTSADDIFRCIFFLAL